MLDSAAPVDLHASQVRKFKFQDMLFHQVTLVFAFIVLAALVGILISLAVEALPVFREIGPAFLWTNVWNVPEDQYGALSAIYGTVVTSVIALLIAVPVSFGIALFLTETCPLWLRRPLGTAIELLAGVPSIIYGIWGLFVFAPLFAEHVQPHLQALLGDVPLIGGWFAALADGGTVDVPFEKAPWGDHFGQVTDRYGVTWMFNSAGGDAA